MNKQSLFILFSLVLSLNSEVSHSHEMNHDKWHNHHQLDSSEKMSTFSVWQLDSTWFNHENKPIKLSELKGDYFFVAMLFTKCETACPLIVEDLKDAVEGLSKANISNVKVAVFSLDSERDTPATLSKFSEKHKLQHNWLLFTSQKPVVSELAAALGVRFKKLPNGDFIHSNAIYFLDREGVVKTKKNGLKTPNKKFIQQTKAAIN